MEPVSTRAWTLIPPKVQETRGWWSAAEQSNGGPTENTWGRPATQPTVEAPFWSLKDSYNY